jgi:hypothetical protein
MTDSESVGFGSSPDIPAKRFWSKVDKNGPMHPTLGRCWLWTAGITAGDRGGYGRFWFNGKDCLAHRIAYQLAGKTIPDGLEIDHRCRNRRCVNPRHLREATNKQNHENLGGPFRNNKSSGVRGVYRGRNGRWMGLFTHNGAYVYCGYFDTKAGAEAAVIARRCELFTHNDLDRT